MTRQVAQLLAVAIVIVVLAHVFEWIVIAAVAGLLCACAVWAFAARSNRTRRTRFGV
jgi:hypothetical protein